MGTRPLHANFPTFVALLGSFFLATHASAQPKIDLVYSELKALAERRSPEILSAEEAVRQANARVYTSWTYWVPRVDLSFSQSRARDYSIVTGGSIASLQEAGIPIFPEAISLSRWDFNLTIPLYRRSVHVGVLQGYGDWRLSLQQLRSRRTELDWRLRQLIGSYLLQSYREAALQTSIEIARRNHREAEIRFQLGQRTRVDVLRAKANLVSLEAKRLTQIQQKSADQKALLEYTGLAPHDLAEAGFPELLSSEDRILSAINRFSESDALIASLKPLMGAETGSAAIAERIVSSSPTYHLLLAQRESADRKLLNITAQEWPELVFRANLNKQAPTWEEAFSPEQRSYSFAVVLTIPIFSGGSVFSTTIEKSHANQAQEIQTEKDIQSLKNQVENDRDRLKSLLSSVEALSLNVDQNEEIVRLSFKSYQLGKTTLLELMTSQNELTDSKINLAANRLDLAVTARKLAWNLGIEDRSGEGKETR